MNQDYYLDANRAHLHIDNIISEKYVAKKLKERMTQLKHISDVKYPGNWDMDNKFQQLLEDIDGLVSFYDGLQNAMDNICMDAHEYFVSARNLLEDTAQNMRDNTTIHAL